MNRLTLALLEVTNGSLPPAVLPFEKGLNVVSGAENRGKSYAFGCLDFLFGASDPPDPNPHSAGYTKATLYYTVNATQRGVVRRGFDSGDAAYLPLHSVDTEVPEAGWQALTKKHGSKKMSLSSYWLEAFGFPSTELRGNMSGKVTALTVRILAHLILVDELRIIAKGSPARSSQATAWPADTDSLAVVLGARLSPPRGTAMTPTVVSPATLNTMREFIGKEIHSLDIRIQELSGDLDEEADEMTELTQRAAEFTAAADAAATGLRTIIAESAAIQGQLLQTRQETAASREITARLELLQEYYSSDVRRLGAVTEVASLLKQLTPVVCPTCNNSFLHDSVSHDEISTSYLEQIQIGARAETMRIVGLRGDLGETLSRTTDETNVSLANENRLTEALIRLKEAELSQNQHVEEVHKQLSQTFATIGELAQRHVLKQRRANLAAALADVPDDQVETPISSPPEDRTQFDSAALKRFCAIIEELLVAWKWNYTPNPITVTFDVASADIMIAGAARRSFGKAARALASSAFIIAIMDYCFEKDLPHPGFVILDSPLTTKKERVKGQNDEQVSDEIVAAFFTHLAEKYADKQVVIFDNKEPPASLSGRLNHIRFEDDATATRAGLFP